MSSISRLPDRAIGRLNLLRASYALHVPTPGDHPHGKRQVEFSILVRFGRLTPLSWPTSHVQSNAEDRDRTALRQRHTPLMGQTSSLGHRAIWDLHAQHCDEGYGALWR